MGAIISRLDSNDTVYEFLATIRNTIYKTESEIRETRLLVPYPLKEDWADHWWNSLWDYAHGEIGPGYSKRQTQEMNNFRTKNPEYRSVIDDDIVWSIKREKLKDEEWSKKFIKARWDQKTRAQKLEIVRKFHIEIQVPQLSSNVKDDSLKMMEFVGEQPHSRHPRY